MKAVVSTPVEEQLVNVNDVEGEYFGIEYDNRCGIVYRDVKGDLRVLWLRSPIAFNQCDNLPNHRDISEFLLWLLRQYPTGRVCQFDSYGEMLVWLSEDGIPR